MMRRLKEAGRSKRWRQDGGWMCQSLYWRWLLRNYDYLGVLASGVF